MDTPPANLATPLTSPRDGTETPQERGNPAEMKIGLLVYLLCSTAIFILLTVLNFKLRRMHIRGTDPSMDRAVFIILMDISLGLLFTSPIVGHWFIRTFKNPGTWRRIRTTVLASIGWAVGTTLFW